MVTPLVRVLLIAESGLGFSPLLERLKNFGCQCHLVSSCLDGARLIEQTSFDLVLCSGRTENFQSLLSAARSSSASLFRYLMVEHGCWWVPTIVRGEPCSRWLAFRDSEFPGELYKLVREVG